MSRNSCLCLWTEQQWTIYEFSCHFFNLMINMQKGQRRKQLLVKGMEISSDLSKILINSMKPMYGWMEEPDQFKYLEYHTNQRQNISKGSEDQTGTGTLKTYPSVFQQRLNSTSHLSSQYCSMYVTAGRWRRIWRGESRLLKTNATEECLAYTSTSIARYHGFAMSVVMICCQKSYYKERWMVVVA